MIKTAERRFWGQSHKEKSNLYSLLHFWKWTLIEVSMEKQRPESVLPNIGSWNQLKAWYTIQSHSWNLFNKNIPWRYAAHCCILEFPTRSCATVSFLLSHPHFHKFEDFCNYLKTFQNIDVESRFQFCTEKVWKYVLIKPLIKYSVFFPLTSMIWGRSITFSDLFNKLWLITSLPSPTFLTFAK